MDLRRALASAGLAGLAFSPLAAQATLPTGFADQLVTSPFTQSSSFDFLPDGRILVIEKASGNVWLVVNGVKGATPKLTITDLNTTGFEQGLLGIAVDPAWPTRPYVYLYFDRTPGNVCYIVRYTAGGDLADGNSTNLTLGSRFVILDDIPDNSTVHNSGTLRFGPDGMLYASLGDDSSHCFAQDSTDFRGKVVRMDVSGLPSSGSGPPLKSAITPADNPFPPLDPELGLVYCFGLRNPFRFQIDGATGRLYIGDVGLSEYEELDESFGGENFGWPYREGPIVRVLGTCSEPGGPGSQTHYVPPIAGYSRIGMASASIIAWPRYRAVPGGAYSFPPEYNGIAFYSDYYGGFVRAIRNFGGVWAPLDSVPGQPSAANWADNLAQISDLRIGPDGAIYYTTLFPGSLRRIVFTGSSTSVGPEPGVGPRLAVHPNPLSRGGSVTVSATDLGALTRVRVFSAGGRLVRTLRPEGATWAWDGRDAMGAAAAPGVYLISAQGTTGSASIRVVIAP
jgi:glucose/arabinose dehydrogenase